MLGVLERRNGDIFIGGLGIEIKDRLFLYSVRGVNGLETMSQEVLWVVYPDNES